MNKHFLDRAADFQVQTDRQSNLDSDDAADINIPGIIVSLGAISLSLSVLLYYINSIIPESIL